MPQISRRYRVVLQHTHHIARFEHRADAGTNRLTAIGNHHLQMDAQMIADKLEQTAQLLRFVHVAHLRAWPDRDVDQQMRRTGGQLFRQDRCHHLAVGVDAERPLD